MMRLEEGQKLVNVTKTAKEEKTEEEGSEENTEVVENAGIENATEAQTTEE